MQASNRIEPAQFKFSMPNPKVPSKFQVAFSFAGEQRELVRAIAETRRLIETHGYLRRQPELEDAEAALKKM
ncbi:MAG: hypothetical protein ACRER2_18860 [Methylococcales bacterium]